MDDPPTTGARPTMSDVAARAGVSLKSVSRVVNGEDHVRPELRARIQQAIEDLDYRPDRRARGLATRGAPRMLGFVQVDASNPFFAAVYRGLEDAVRDREILVLTGSTDAAPARERDLLRTFLEFRVDGLVVAAAEGSDDLLRREIARGTPVVCIDRVLEGAVCDTVVSDNRDSTRAAVAHLLARGHERIAFLGGNQDIWTARERRSGYLEAMTAAGRPADLTTEVDSVERAERAVRRLLDRPTPPTALFCAQDRIATGAIAALHATGAHHHTALFGFDELPFAEQLDPPVAVVAQDPYAMGRRAAELLLARTSDPGADPVLEVMPTQIRYRASGDVLPG